MAKGVRWAWLWLWIGAGAPAVAAEPGELLALRAQLAEEYMGPGWTNYDLTNPAEVARAREAAQRSPQDIPALHRALRREGDPASAALLAMIGDRRALPEIGRWFMRGDFFYGWESCVPMEVEPANWPHHMIYADALRLLTGEGPEQIHPSARQIAAMEREGRTYALALYAPERALARFAAEFRAGDRVFAVASLLTVLPMGMSRSEAEELLGPADLPAPDAHTLQWDLGEDMCAPRAMSLRFAQGRLASAEMVVREAAGEAAGEVGAAPGTTLEAAPPAAPGAIP